MGSWIEDPAEFYEELEAAMPLDTKIFGCNYGDRYFAILGFPYSFNSWVGLKGHLYLKQDFSTVVFFVLQEGYSVNEWIEWMHLFCKTPSPLTADLHFVFGEEFVEEDLKVNKDGVVSTAGDMWIKD